jgi:dimethylhistidine N-methyltransferase
MRDAVAEKVAEQAAETSVTNQNIDNQQVNFIDLQPDTGDMPSELLEGLTRSKQKTIIPKYFYDATGSELFEQITQVAEYYPTRTERKILTDNMQDIVKQVGTGGVLIEPGAGSAEKIRLLLEPLQTSACVLTDISAKFLQQSSADLAQQFPNVSVHAICADFANKLDLPEDIPQAKKVVFYPGSTLGNFHPEQAENFLQRSQQSIGDDGGLLIGVDLQKDIDTLNAAYNDEQGLTAEFNLNILNNINSLTESDFNTAAFEHKAFYNTEEHRIEMHLVSKQDQAITIEETQIELRKGETLHTENSYKYTPESFAQLAKKVGLKVIKRWTDSEKLFGVFYLEPVSY